MIKKAKTIRLKKNDILSIRFKFVINEISSKRPKLLSENITVISGKNKAKEKSSSKIIKNIKTNINRNLIINELQSSKKWDNQFKFIEIPKNIKPSWMGFPILLSKKFKKKKKKFMNYLDLKGIETRPIISGNFLRQPVAKLYKLDKEKGKFRNADEIQNLGFFIGLHTQKITNKSLNKLVNALLSI